MGMSALKNNINKRIEIPLTHNYSTTKLAVGIAILLLVIYLISQEQMCPNTIDN